MEILRGFGLPLPARQNRSRAMSQRDFSDPDARCWTRQSGESQPEEVDDVWPEVSSNYSLDDSIIANPENSPRRVLSEVILILAIAGLAAVAAGFLVPALS
jgi:hypothetical protein